MIASAVRCDNLPTLTARMHMIASKELPRPMAVDELPLRDPVSNLAEHGSQSKDDQAPASISTDEEKAS